MRREAKIPILPTLKARAEFLAVRGGRRASTPAFLIEMRERAPVAGAAAGPAPKNTANSRRAPAAGARFGFTITKKMGNAVARNRIRRRLKAAFAAGARQHTEKACDYVVVARLAALDRPFTDLIDDVARSMSALHRASADAPRKSRSGTPSGPSEKAVKKGSA